MKINDIKPNKNKKEVIKVMDDKETMRLQMDFDLIIGTVKQIKALISILAESDLGISIFKSTEDLKPTNVIESISIPKHNIIRNIIVEKLELSSDKIRILLNKFNKD